MIKELFIQNLQSHEKSTLVFDSGVNIIIGTTDSGKTAILRALKLVIWNRPSGNAYRSWWGGTTRVRIKTEKNTIIRIKDAKRNKYILNKTDFAAMGTKVPDEIITALNIDEINFQQQLDSPFLLTKTPGEVASHFNRIAHLQDIDTSLKNVLGWTRHLSQDIKNDRLRLKSSKKELTDYTYLDKLEVQMEVLEGCQKRKDQLSKQSKELKSLITRINTLKVEIQNASEELKHEEAIDSILGLITAKKEKELKVQNLKNLLVDIKRVTDKISEATYLITLENQVNSLTLIKKDIANEKDKVQKFHVILKTIKQTQKEIVLSENEIVFLENEFHTHMPDICPLCGTDLIKTKKP